MVIKILGIKILKHYIEKESGELTALPYSRLSWVCFEVFSFMNDFDSLSYEILLMVKYVLSSSTLCRAFIIKTNNYHYSEIFSECVEMNNFCI